MPKFHPERFFLNWSWCSLSIRMFQSSLSDSKVQRRLRTTALKPSPSQVVLILFNSTLSTQWRKPKGWTSLTLPFLTIGSPHPVPSTQSWIQRILWMLGQMQAQCALSLSPIYYENVRPGYAVGQYCGAYTKRKLKESQRNKADTWWTLAPTWLSFPIAGFFRDVGPWIPFCVDQFTLDFLMPVTKYP